MSTRPPTARAGEVASSVDTAPAAPGDGDPARTRPMPALGNTAQRARPRIGGISRPGGARRIAAVLALLLAAAAVTAVVVANPFGGSSPSSGSSSNNAVATSLATVERRSLSSQQTENGTLGYAGLYTVINQAGGSRGGENGGESRGGAGGGHTITWLPAVGEVIRDGGLIYEVDGEPIVLLYGATPAYRTLSQGMSGKDVAELNAELIALGYATGAEIDEHPEYFGAETKGALKALQEKLGVKEENGVKLGQLALGQAVFLPSPALRITKVTGTLGGAAQTGSPILEASSTRRQVVVKLDAAAQASIKKGDHVAITLPNNQTTPGVVSSVGKVAQSSSSGGRGGAGGNEEEGTPTIEVQITPTDPRATGTLDKAPVRVAIMTASEHHVLVVPINALLALAEGGYALELAEGRARRLVGVSLGIFDDAEGKVAVSGAEVRAGQHVVVPST